MAKVDLGTVEFNDASQLLKDRCAGCFDTKNLEDLSAAVRVRPLEINTFLAHHLLQIHPIRLQHPLLVVPRVKPTLLIDDDFRVLDEEDSFDSRNTTECDRFEHRIFELPEEDVLLDTIVFLVWAAHDSTTNDQLFGIVFTPDDEKILVERLRDPAGDVGHGELAVDHFRAIEF